MDIAIDEQTGDLLIESGDLQVLEGLDAIAQHVAIRLRFFQGEWFLDTRIGIPYYADVLIKNPDLNLVRSLIRSAITSTPGVVALQSMDLDFDAAERVLSLAFEADTEEGPLTFDRELILG